jgi:hypothetical protein
MEGAFGKETQRKLPFETSNSRSSDRDLKIEASKDKSVCNQLAHRQL